MKNEIIESYTWNILKKQLQKAKISNTALYNIIDNKGTIILNYL